MYEVDLHSYGRPLITREGPCQGLLDWPRSQWTRITRRPIGLKRAIALADAQPGHAVVCKWGSTTKVHDNGKVPVLPEKWWPATATTPKDARSN